MENLIYSHYPILPKIQMKTKSFELSFLEKFNHQLSSSMNSYSEGDPMKKYTSEEVFHGLFFNTHKEIYKERLIDFSKKKIQRCLSSRKGKQERDQYKALNFEGINLTKKIALPARRKKIICIRSPHVKKKSQEHFEQKISQYLTLLSCRNSLQKKSLLIFFKKLTHEKFPGILIQFNIHSSSYWS